jgi:hypothetical protein
VRAERQDPRSPSLSFLFWRSGLVVSQCARVQRGESATARCASTEDCRVFSLPAALVYLFNGSLVDPLARASNEHVSTMFPPSLLVSLSWKGTHVGLRAAVERGGTSLFTCIQRGGWSGFHCAHRATTAPPWGLCEHRDQASRLAIPFLGRAFREHRTNVGALPLSAALIEQASPISFRLFLEEWPGCPFCTHRTSTFL